MIVGRLAPSPTGRLHLGNLSSSVLAYAQARSGSGKVILRVEDLDPPRTVDGAAQAIVADLRWIGISWDEGPDVGGPAEPYVQSLRTRQYEAAVAQLSSAGLLYPCFCSRREIRDSLSAPHGPAGGTAYLGTCSRLSPGESERRAAAEPHALRFRVPHPSPFHDGICGDVRPDSNEGEGDFVVRRRDGLYSYHLAVVADDIAMGVTDVVRGRDLLEATFAQRSLFRALATEPPRTWHVPLLVAHDGVRLSKRSGSVARDGLESVGWSPALLLGALCALWGWVDRLEPLSIDEVVSLWSPASLAESPVRVDAALFSGPSAFRAALRSKRDL